MIDGSRISVNPAHWSDELALETEGSTDEDKLLYHSWSSIRTKATAQDQTSIKDSDLWKWLS